jgi:hypothetical protein
LENNKSKVLCNFYAEGFCQHGDKCHFMHPGAGRNADEKVLGLSKSKYDGDDETQCQVCLEPILKKG